MVFISGFTPRRKINKILSVEVAIAISISVTFRIYVNLPKQTDAPSEDSTIGSYILSFDILK
jgi:hypothetical protein